MVIQRSWKSYYTKKKFWDSVSQILAESRAGLLLKKHINRYKLRKRDRLIYLVKERVTSLT
jgi:hypothetical protein